MLFKILRILASGERFSNNSIARELQVDEALVEQMIAQLQRLGYIEKENMDDCSSGCNCEGACSTEGNCCGNNHNIDINIWKITEKGKANIK